MSSPLKVIFPAVRYLSFLFSLCLTFPVVAQYSGTDGERSLQFSSPDRVGASIQLYWPDEERGTDTSSLGYDVFYERDLKRWKGFWRVRAFHEILETTDRVVSDFYRRGIGLDMGRNWAIGRGSEAGVFAGAGWVVNDVVPDERDANDWFGTFGLQVTSPQLPDTRLKVRGSLRANYDNYSGGVLDWQGSISFVLPLR